MATYFKASRFYYYLKITTTVMAHATMSMFSSRRRWKCRAARPVIFSRVTNRLRYGSVRHDARFLHFSIFDARLAR